MWYVFKTAWGWSTYLIEDGSLQRLVLPLEVSCAEFLDYYALSPANTRITSGPASGLAAQIQAYFAGEPIRCWKATLNLACYPPFTRRVLQLTAAIPYGETRTYGQLAGSAGSPRAARAVGQVMASNPIPLVVPCHRVVGKNSPTGFSAPGGVAYKQALLELERKGKGALTP